MSRKTARAYWQATFGYAPDLTRDLFMGDGRVEVLFDDRMAYGDIRFVDLNASL